MSRPVRDASRTIRSKPSTPQPIGLSVYAEKVALADFHAVVPQDAVCGRGMKVEVRERKMAEKLLPLEGHGLAGSGRKADLTILGAFELRGLEFFYIVDGLREPLLQLVKGCFGVRRGRHLAVGETRATFRGKIADELNLSGQRQHVRKQSGAEQHIGLNLLRGGMGLGLVENGGQAVEDLQVSRNGSIVERHVFNFSIGEVLINLSGSGVQRALRRCQEPKDRQRDPPRIRASSSAVGQEPAGNPYLICIAFTALRLCWPMMPSILPTLKPARTSNCCISRSSLNGSCAIGAAGWCIGGAPAIRAAR